MWEEEFYYQVTYGKVFVPGTLQYNVSEYYHYLMQGDNNLSSGTFCTNSIDKKKTKTKYFFTIDYVYCIVD